MKPAICASFPSFAHVMNASRLPGMVADDAPISDSARTSSAVGASFAGKSTCIGRLHPAREKQLCSFTFEFKQLWTTPQAVLRFWPTCSPQGQNIDPCRYHVMKIASKDDHSFPLKMSERIVRCL